MYDLSHSPLITIRYQDRRLCRTLETNVDNPSLSFLRRDDWKTYLYQAHWRRLLFTLTHNKSFHEMRISKAMMAVKLYISRWQSITSLAIIRPVASLKSAILRAEGYNIWVVSGSASTKERMRSDQRQNRAPPLPRLNVHGFCFPFLPSFVRCAFLLAWQSQYKLGDYPDSIYITIFFTLSNE